MFQEGRYKMQIVKQKPVTYTCLILDQSGSMCDRVDSAVIAFNENVQQAQLNSKSQDIYVSLLTFNGEVFEHLWNKPSEELRQTTAKDYRASGSTALNDALGYAVQKLLATTHKDDSNVGYLIQVITDGEENASKVYGNNYVNVEGTDPVKFVATGEVFNQSPGKVRYGHQDLQDLIKKVQETGRWTFAFMGCDGDYLEKMSKQLNIPTGNFAAYNPDQKTSAGLSSSLGANKLYQTRSTGQHVNSSHTPFFGGLADQFQDLTNVDPNDIQMQVAVASSSVGDVSQLVCNQQLADNVFSAKDPVNWTNLISKT